MSRGIVLPVAVAALLGSGCVAWNVGEPVSHVEQVGSRIESKTLAEQPVSARPVFSQPDGTRFQVGLSATVEQEVEMRKIVSEKTVTTQNRMSLGLFPGWAELVYERNSGLGRALRETKDGMSDDSVPVLLKVVALPPAFVTVAAFQVAGGIIYTPYAMLVEPFSGSYECFRPGHDDGSLFDHMALVGFHRFQRVSDSSPTERVES